MSLCSRSSSRQILMALSHPRCGQITTNQRAICSKGSSPCWRAGLLMLGPRRDSRHLKGFLKSTRLEVINIIRARWIHWRRFCRKDVLQTRFTAALGLLERLPSPATNQNYRGRFTRERKQQRLRSKDRRRRLAPQQHHDLRHRGRLGMLTSRTR